MRKLPFQLAAQCVILVYPFRTRGNVVIRESPFQERASSNHASGEGRKFVVGEYCNGRLPFYAEL